jgi:hypothetical protein
MYFLYRHIRLDTNQPFYIGVGKKPKTYRSYRAEYQRAFIKDKRNIYWKRIVEKAGYKVEILFEADSSEEIFQKEKEFIALYGRSDLKTGILCNLTDGGDGVFNYKFSEKEIERRRQYALGENNSFRGKKHSEQTKSYLSQLHSGENHPQYGKKRSEETKRKISESRFSGNNPGAVTVLDTYTGIYYLTIKEAAETISNLTVSGLQYRLKFNKDKRFIRI